MAMRCKICNHEKRLMIDRELVANGNVAQIARKYGVGYDSLNRHFKRHLTRQLAKAQETRDMLHSKNMLDQITGLLAKAKEIIETAEVKGHLNTALKGVAEARNTIELLAKLAYLLHDEQKREEQKVYEDFAVKARRLTKQEMELYVKLLAKMEGKRTGHGAEIKIIDAEPVKPQKTDVAYKRRRRPANTPNPVPILEDDHDYDYYTENDPDDDEPQEVNFDEEEPKDREGMTRSYRMRRRPAHEIAH